MGRKQKMNIMKLTYDEIYATGDMNTLFEKVMKHTKIKLGMTRFAGMEQEDVVQETTIKVFRSLDYYNQSKSKLNTFIDRVIENAIKDCYKKCSSRKNLLVVNSEEIIDNYELSEEHDCGTQIGVVDSGFENTEFLNDVLNNIGLSDREKQVFEFYLDGYDFVEIAKIIGVTKSRMSQIWSSIKKKYNQS